MINQNGMNFSRKHVEDMGNPPFVRTLFDPHKKIFAIQVCKQTDDHVLKFSKPRSEQRGGVIISFQPLMHFLRDLMGAAWDKKHRYKIDGKCLSESRVTVFYLDNAEECPLYKAIKKAQ
jgi:hypothetical protein